MLFFAVAHSFAFRARDFWPQANLQRDPSLAGDIERQLQRTGRTSGGAARAAPVLLGAAGGARRAGTHPLWGDARGEASGGATAGASLVAATAAAAAATAAAAEQQGAESPHAVQGAQPAWPAFTFPSSRAAHGTLSGRGVGGVVATLAKRAVSIAGCGDVRANVAGQVSDSVQSVAESGSTLVGSAASRLSQASSAASRSFRKIVPGSVVRQSGLPSAARDRRRESTMPLTASIGGRDGEEGGLSDAEDDDFSSAAAIGGASGMLTVDGRYAAAHASSGRVPWLFGEPGAGMASAPRPSAAGQQGPKSRSAVLAPSCGDGGGATTAASAVNVGVLSPSPVPQSAGEALAPQRAAPLEEGGGGTQGGGAAGVGEDGREIVAIGPGDSSSVAVETADGGRTSSQAQTGAGGVSLEWD